LPDAAVEQNVLLVLTLGRNLGKQIAVTDTTLRIFLFPINIAVKRLRDQTDLINYEAI
jgi:hypothetical protein